MPRKSKRFSSATYQDFLAGFTEDGANTNANEKAKATDKSAARVSVGKNNDRMTIGGNYLRASKSSNPVGAGTNRNRVKTPVTAAPASGNANAAYWLGLETLRVLTFSSNTRWQLLLKMKVEDDSDSESDNADLNKADNNNANNGKKNNVDQRDIRRWKWIAYEDFQVNDDFSLKVGKPIARDSASLDDFDPLHSGEHDSIP